MAVYRYDKSIRLYRRSRSKTFLIFLLALLGIGLITLFLITRGNEAAVTSGKKVRVSNDPYLTFTTEYFSFKASKSWSEAKDLNTKDTYVYRKYNSTTPIGILTINVNAGYPSLITAVVPVTITGGLIDEVGAVSDHCSKFLPGGLNLDPHDVVVEEINFRCWTDSTALIVSAGVRGGGLELPFLRPGGEIAKYSISYQGTSFNNDKNAILEVLKTFRAL